MSARPQASADGGGGRAQRALHVSCKSRWRALGVALQGQFAVNHSGTLSCPSWLRQRRDRFFDSAVSPLRALSSSRASMGLRDVFKQSAVEPASLIWEETWRDTSQWILVDACGGFGNQELQRCAFASSSSPGDLTPAAHRHTCLRADRGRATLHQSDSPVGPIPLRQAILSPPARTRERLPRIYDPPHTAN